MALYSLRPLVYIPSMFLLGRMLRLTRLILAGALLTLSVAGCASPIPILRVVACSWCDGAGTVNCFCQRWEKPLREYCLECNGHGKFRCGRCKRSGEMFSLIPDGRELPPPPVAPNGSSHGELDSSGRPKTVFVRSYTKADGTYVASHYRAPPKKVYARQQNGEYFRTYSVPGTGSYWSTRRTWSPRSGPGVAENGSYYGEYSERTGLPKTTHVRGYYRKDGTYVRGHYRSRR